MIKIFKNIFGGFLLIFSVFIVESLLVSSLVDNVTRNLDFSKMIMYDGTYYKIISAPGEEPFLVPYMSEYKS